jgi:hypothetical protein
VHACAVSGFGCAHELSEATSPAESRHVTVRVCVPPPEQVPPPHAAHAPSCQAKQPNSVEHVAATHTPESGSHTGLPSGQSFDVAHASSHVLVAGSQASEGEPQSDEAVHATQ